MGDAISHLQPLNFISVAIAVVLAFSVVQGAARGGFGSFRHLAALIADVALTALGLFLAWKCAEHASPWLRNWLDSRGISPPQEETNSLLQIFFTFVAAVRDFPLMRFALLFVASYIPIKILLQRLAAPLYAFAARAERVALSRRGSWASLLAGGAIGAVTGIWRALLLVAVLFVYTSLFPNAPATAYIQSSELYRKGAMEVIRPFAGDFIAENMPVLTRAVEEEFNRILRKRYEIIDANIPPDIAEAARQITADAETDEEKARRLYRWVGTRVEYDWNKVRLYEEERIWREQTPEETFATKKGVCIDYARLYAVMARAVGLQAKVETGLGYDGRGGYGPHAWNVVYLSERDEWVPLDATWVASGGNWFNPPHFYETHIKEV